MNSGDRKGGPQWTGGGRKALALQSAGKGRILRPAACSAWRSGRTARGHVDPRTDIYIDAESVINYY